MKTGFLITARLKSKRLKLKILLPLNGYTVIERVIQRAKAVDKCDGVVLCTSMLNQDLPLVQIAKKENIYHFNGHAEDVLQRLLDACMLFGFDFFIGITADNPLFSIHHASLISNMIQKDPALDYVYTHSMPVGVNIYAVNVKALKTVCTIKEQVDTEIWGYLINQPEIFNVKEIPIAQDFIRSNYRLTLDEKDDYLFFKTLYSQFDKDNVIDILDAYQYLDNNPQVAQINTNVKQRDLDEETKKKIDEHYMKNRAKILKIKEIIYADDQNELPLI